jgi:3-(3-hydroxy-phenyl)propionate hydroxylase
MLGPDVEFEFEWLSVYTFQCRRMERFVHDRVIFAGDAAHLVSPFGARGCNGGLQDIDNLAWKLDLVIGGAAPRTLLETYNSEAIAVAEVNIMNSTRSTDFMTPKSAAARAFRDAVLELARDHDFARPFVNSGRLSQAVPYAHSPLSTADADSWTAGPGPGAPAIDAPIGENSFLLERLGDRFVVLDFSGAPHDEINDEADIIRLSPGNDAYRLAANRYGCETGGAYLIRPDQHVAARWRQPTAEKVNAAIARSKGKEPLT